MAMCMSGLHLPWPPRHPRNPAVIWASYGHIRLHLPNIVLDIRACVHVLPAMYNFNRVYGICG